MKSDQKHFSYNSRLHDIKNFHISLKQWRMLHAVVDCGGYADAANQLHLSQSTISYAIAKLQHQLGIPLLKIEGRKAHITEAGKAMLEQSRILIRQALELEQYGENLRQGRGKELRLVVDHNFPSRLLMLALRNFFQFNHVNVRLHEVTKCQAKKALCEQTADLAISSQVPLGFLGDALIDLEHIAVAHPNHSLSGIGRSVTATDLRRQIEVVICDSVTDENYTRNDLSPENISQWRVNSLDTAIGALTERLGYAWLPKHQIKKWLDEDTLRALPLAEGCVYRKTLYLIHGRSWGRCPGAEQLAKMLFNVVATESEERPRSLAT